MYFVKIKSIILVFLFLAYFESLEASAKKDLFEDFNFFEEDDALQQGFNNSHGYSSAHATNNNTISTTVRGRTRSTDIAIRSAKVPFNTYQNDCRILFNAYRSIMVITDEDETKDALFSLMNATFIDYGEEKLDCLFNEINSHNIDDQGKLETFQSWFEERKAELLSQS